MRAEERAAEQYNTAGHDERHRDQHCCSTEAMVEDHEREANREHC